MGSLNDATSDNSTQETTLATIRSVSGDWDNSAVRTEMHAASGDWDNATVNVTSVSGISAVANTNSSEGQGSGTYREGQERLNLDKMKAMMNQENQEAKLEQEADLAGLRAGVSLAKQSMADQSKIHDFGRNFGKK